MSRSPPRIARTVIQSKRRPNPRRAAAHLGFVRCLPCIACGAPAPSQAAHVRSSGTGGIGLKPMDKFSLPLCGPGVGEGCHAKQHRIGEPAFWSALGIDPVDAALRLWTVSGDLTAGARLVFRARQAIELHQRQEPR